jgi:hypothetical protein
VILEERMRYMMLFVCGVLAACGDDGEVTDTTPEPATMTSSEFDEAFADRFCAEIEICGDATCEPTTTSSDFDYSACTFDGVAAAACIEAEWTCAEIVEGLFLPVPAAECEGVYTCPE